MKMTRYIFSFFVMVFTLSLAAKPGSRRNSISSTRMRRGSSTYKKVPVRASSTVKRQSQSRVAQVTKPISTTKKGPTPSKAAKTAGKNPGRFKATATLVGTSALATKQLKKQAQAVVQEGNDVIRDDYNFAQEELPEINNLLKAQNVPVEKRARILYHSRHRSRLKARQGMKDKKLVKDLEERDKEKYGNKDGPTFDYLVEKNMAKGMSKEQAMESIIDSAQRTSPQYNALYGNTSAPERAEQRQN